MKTYYSVFENCNGFWLVNDCNSDTFLKIGGGWDERRDFVQNKSGFSTFREAVSELKSRVDGISKKWVEEKTREFIYVKEES